MLICRICLWNSWLLYFPSPPFFLDGADLFFVQNYRVSFYQWVCADPWSRPTSSFFPLKTNSAWNCTANWFCQPSSSLYIFTSGPAPAAGTVRPAFFFAPQEAEVSRPLLASSCFSSPAPPFPSPTEFEPALPTFAAPRLGPPQAASAPAPFAAAKFSSWNWGVIISSSSCWLFLLIPHLCATRCRLVGSRGPSWP